MGTLKLNAAALEKQINKELVAMVAVPFLEETRFAIAEVDGMQVHIVVTRDEDEFIEVK